MCVCVFWAGCGAVFGLGPVWVAQGLEGVLIACVFLDIGLDLCFKASGKGLGGSGAKVRIPYKVVHFSWRRVE